MDDIRIVLADDHQVMRQGLAELLQRRSGFSVVAEASTGQEAVECCLRLQPDVILLDVTMPKMSGIEATQKLRQELPELKILALSMHSEKEYISKMFSAGANGYLLKDAGVDQVIVGINTVLGNKVFLAPELIEVVVEDYTEILGKAQGTVDQAPPLTPREREIVKLIAEGNSAKKVATKLSISESTVHTHRQQILKKLDLKNTVELTRYAIRSGLTQL